MHGAHALVSWLRAAGEATRLRLLALTAESALSVSDLAQAVKQSEPRVSRHLRILAEAGLISRVRRGQWVHYGLAEEPEAAGFVRGLLGQLDRSDPLLARDRSGAHSAAASGRHGGGESRLGRALAALLGEALAGQGAPVLVVGVSHPELLEAAARGGPCTAIAHSRRAAQAARAFAERRGFGCRIVEARGSDLLGDAVVVRAGDSFAAVLLDHSHADGALAPLLERARRVLSGDGRLWLFERYESLEGARGRVVEHPLARLRRLLGDAGLWCERLNPIEADGEHVLAALARPAAADGAAGARA
jgi:DNA-binding transcriptional ArsR family regulator